MTAPRFKLETSDSGTKFLTVWYLGTGWQQAINEGLAAYGLVNNERVQIVALPMPAEAK